VRGREKLKFSSRKGESTRGWYKSVTETLETIEKFLPRTGEIGNERRPTPTGAARRGGMPKKDLKKEAGKTTRKGGAQIARQYGDNGTGGGGGVRS